MPGKKPPKLPQEDSLDTFFRSVASTMRTFSQADIAELKMEILNAVAKKEIALSNSQQSGQGLQYVIAVNSQEGEGYIPVDIQHIDYAGPNEENVSHSFMQIKQVE